MVYLPTLAIQVNQVYVDIFHTWIICFFVQKYTFNSQSGLQWNMTLLCQTKACLLGRCQFHLIRTNTSNQLNTSQGHPGSVNPLHCGWRNLSHLEWRESMGPMKFCGMGLMSFFLTTGTSMTCLDPENCNITAIFQSSRIRSQVEKIHFATDSWNLFVSEKLFGSQLYRDCFTYHSWN